MLLVGDLHSRSQTFHRKHEMLVNDCTSLTDMEEMPTSNGNAHTSKTFSDSFLTFLEKRQVRENRKFSLWAQARMEAMTDFRVAPEIERLSSRGFCVQTLAIATILITLAPGLDHYFKAHFGDRKTREKKCDQLANAIPVLREFDKICEGFTGDQTPNEFLRDFQLPLPCTVIAGLEYYSLMLMAGERVFKFLEANSILELTKYAFATSVKRVTDKYHDREVSALTGAALQNFEYDETAHRVWRIRTLPRLQESKGAILADLLTALNHAVSRTKK